MGGFSSNPFHSIRWKKAGPHLVHWGRGQPGWDSWWPKSFFIYSIANLENRQSGRSSLGQGLKQPLKKKKGEVLGRGIPYQPILGRAWSPSTRLDLFCKQVGESITRRLKGKNSRKRRRASMRLWSRTLHERRRRALTKSYEDEVFRKITSQTFSYWMEEDWWLFVLER